MGLKLAQVVRRLVKEEWGGIETTVLSTANALEKKAISSPIFTTAIGTKPGREKEQHVEVRRFRYVLPWLFLKGEEREALLKKGGSPFSLRLFFSLLFEKGLTHIHTHNLHRIGGIARLVAKLRSIPYVVTLHSGYFTLPPKQKELMKMHFQKRYEWGKWFDTLFGIRHVIRDAAAVICVSVEELQFCKREMPEKRLFYLPNGVDLHHFLPNEETKRGKKILSVARIDPQKNQLTLIQAFAKFLKRHPEYSLELIGAISDRAYYNLLLEEISALKLSHKVQIVPGFLASDLRLRYAYNSAEFFVLPSVHEPFGIVILEAWAMHCPVIASRVGGIPGFAEDNKTALLFNTREELLEKMELLASCAATKARLVDAAKKEVQEYSWERISERLVAIYESL